MIFLFYRRFFSGSDRSCDHWYPNRKINRRAWPIFPRDGLPMLYLWQVIFHKIWTLRFLIVIHLISFLQMIQHALPLCLTISWVYAFAMLTQSIVYEKEVRLKEVMKIMGLGNAVHWVAWFITIFSQTTLVMIAITLILHYGKVLLHSNPFLIFLIFEIYALATISLA